MSIFKISKGKTDSVKNTNDNVNHYSSGTDNKGMKPETKKSIIK
ncbi:hypothetical protein FACS189459_4810 [Bacilli bacterium]|nr:hypothetical protein FACS189459_4810 [Bacilli bacterium]